MDRNNTLGCHVIRTRIDDSETNESQVRERDLKEGRKERNHIH